MDEIKALHKEWFPIEYSKEFYESIKKGKTLCLVAVYETEIKHDKHTLILGLITYEIRDINYKLLRFSFEDFYTSKKAIYILTLGVSNEVRKLGLASKLLEKLYDIAKEDYRVKYIYLHVVDYNDTAIKFYERNNFQKVMTKYHHYNIYGKLYGGYVYCFYTNGGSFSGGCDEAKRKCLAIVRLLNIPKQISLCFRYAYSKLYSALSAKNKSPGYKEIRLEE